MAIPENIRTRASNQLLGLAQSRRSEIGLPVFASLPNPAREPKKRSYFSEFSDSFAHSLLQQNPRMVGAAVEAFGESTNMPKVRDWGRGVRQWASGLDIGEPPSVSSWGDVQDIDSAARFLLGGLGSGIGSTAPTLALGGVGGLALRSAGPLARSAGFVGGAVAGSAPMNAGEAFEQFLDEGVEYGRAATAAVQLTPVLSGLDAVGALGIWGSATRPAQRKILSHVARRLATGAAAEGSTETLQALTREAVAADLTDRPDVARRALRVLDEATIGALVGGTFGAARGALAPVAREPAPEPEPIGLPPPPKRLAFEPEPVPEPAPQAPAPPLALPAPARPLALPAPEGVDTPLADSGGVMVGEGREGELLSPYRVDDLPLAEGGGVVRPAGWRDPREPGFDGRPVRVPSRTPAPIVKRNGQPYPSPQAALLGMRGRKLEGYEPVPIEGGFGLLPRIEPEPAPEPAPELQAPAPPLALPAPARPLALPAPEGVDTPLPGGGVMVGEGREGEALSPYLVEDVPLAEGGGVVRPAGWRDPREPGFDGRPVRVPSRTPAPIVKRNGQPYPSPQAALLGMRGRKLEGYEPVPIEGGFGLLPRIEPEPAPEPAPELQAPAPPLALPAPARPLALPAPEGVDTPLPGGGVMVGEGREGEALSPYLVEDVPLAEGGGVVRPAGWRDPREPGFDGRPVRVPSRTPARS